MWELIRRNRRRSILLFGLMAGILVAFGASLGYALAPEAGWYWGMVAACLVWGALAIVTVVQGDSVVLSMSGATEVPRELHPTLHNVVEEMSIAAGLGTVPKIYVVPDTAPNAFAVGGSLRHSSVVVTAGLLTTLDRDELQGVVAHEIAHIQNRDVLFLTHAGVMLGSIVMMSESFARLLRFSYGRAIRVRTRGGKNGPNPVFLIAAVLFAFLGPVLARLLYYAISREREFLADASAARLTRYPQGLADALEKISGASGSLPSLTSVTGPMYISDPVAQTDDTSRRGFMDRLAATHPPAAQRIAILRKLAGEPSGTVSLRQYQRAWVSVTGARTPLLGEAAMESLDRVEQRRSASTDTPVGLGGLHAALDLVRAANRYKFVTCGCGMQIKIPPDYARPGITCPRCGESHLVPGVVAEMAAGPKSTAPAAELGQTPVFEYVRQHIGGWESVECGACRRVLNLSPALHADRINCPGCGSVTRLKSAQA